MGSRSINQCLLCRAVILLKSIDHHRENETQYWLYHCDQCQGEFWTPFRNPGAAWYEHDPRYASINSNPYSEVNWHQKFTLDFVETISGPGALFDIGCGTGNFLAFARQRGWRVAGVDFDGNAVRAAKEVFGIREVEQTDLLNYARGHSARRFNLVTFFDVFEHIDKHREFLAAITGIIVSGGHIAMSMPHRKGSFWLRPHDLPPRHLTRWDEMSLTTILNRHGYTVVYLKAMKASINYVILKLRFRYGQQVSFNLVDRLKKAVPKSKENVKSRKIRIVLVAARLKDWLIFGLPALAIWVWLVATRRDAIGLFAIAREDENRNP